MYINMGTTTMNIKRLDYTSLLIARVGLLNVGWLTGFGLLWFKGYIEYLLEDRTTVLAVFVILTLATAGVLVSLWRAAQIGAILDARSRVTATVLHHASSRLRPLYQLAGTLTLLGLVGTVVGFIVALYGVDQAGVADPSAIGKIVATLMHGMGIALYTTLAGAVGYLWVISNVWMLEGGIDRMRGRTL